MPGGDTREPNGPGVPSQGRGLFTALDQPEEGLSLASEPFQDRSDSLSPANALRGQCVLTILALQ